MDDWLRDGNKCSYCCVTRITDTAMQMRLLSLAMCYKQTLLPSGSSGVLSIGPACLHVLSIWWNYLTLTRRVMSSQSRAAQSAEYLTAWNTNSGRIGGLKAFIQIVICPLKCITDSSLCHWVSSQCKQDGWGGRDRCLVGIPWFEILMLMYGVYRTSCTHELFVCVSGFQQGSALPEQQWPSRMGEQDHAADG